VGGPESRGGLKRGQQALALLTLYGHRVEMAMAIPVEHDGQGDLAEAAIAVVENR
jgi:hypothetical protein